MNRQISPDQALALSFSPFRYREIKRDKKGNTVRDEEGCVVYEIASTSRFIKPGETQVNALKRLRSSGLGRTKQGTVSRRIPHFEPGVTSTAMYVAQFERMNSLLPTGSAKHLTRPAPLLDGEDTVEVLDVNTFADDLV